MVVAVYVVFTSTAHAQQLSAVGDSLAEHPDAGMLVDPMVQPEFPGGFEKMYAFIRKELNYPKAAEAHGIKGKVHVEFVVETDGTLSEFKVAKGVAPLLYAVALRVVSMMPGWTPGERNDEAVRCRMVLPLKFEPR